MDFRIPEGMTPLAYERISGATLDTAQALATATHTVLVTSSENPDPPEGAYVRKAEAALVTVALNTIRFTIHGTDPTAGAGGVGHSVPALSSFVITGFQEITAFKVINADTTLDAEVTVTTFYK